MGIHRRTVRVGRRSVSLRAVEPDEREHQIGFRLPGGGAVVLDLHANRGRLMVYLPAVVTVRQVEGLDDIDCPCPFGRRPR